MDAYLAKSKQRTSDAKEALEAWEQMPPVEQLMSQEWQLYFPGLFPDLKTHHYAPYGFAQYSTNNPHVMYFTGNYRGLGPHYSTVPYNTCPVEGCSREPVNHHKGT